MSCNICQLPKSNPSRKTTLVFYLDLRHQWLGAYSWTFSTKCTVALFGKQIVLIIFHYKLISTDVTVEYSHAVTVNSIDVTIRLPSITLFLRLVMFVLIHFASQNGSGFLQQNVRKASESEGQLDYPEPGRRITREIGQEEEDSRRAQPLLELFDTRLELMSILYWEVQDDVQRAQLHHSYLSKSHKRRYSNNVSVCQ